MGRLAIRALLRAAVVLPIAIACGGCRKTEVRLDGHGRPRAQPAWDEPTVSNGFHAVAPKSGRCPPQGYQMSLEATD